ncbi:hypothetical protein TrVE_jg14115 [Triparma verrucosa]|uniref:Uncharacterized protein n=1 Tax=Triparma verrucosa TaxID=1606542 RepID=A0A9W7EUV6_9STRA|nr:hypothetical protein TrVE_jg14115 [Triparma verrucosa]
MKRSFNASKNPASTSAFSTKKTKPGPAGSKKKKKKIKDVPPVITDSYVECLQTPPSSEHASAALEKFLLICREHSQSLLGCVRHLCKVATSAELAWDLRVRSAQMLHSLLLRSVSCREEFSGGGDPSHCLRLVESAVSGVGVEDRSNVDRGVDVSQKLATAVMQLLVMLDEQFGSNPRFTVARRLMEQRMASSLNSSARVGVVLGAGLARVSEQARERRILLVKEAVEKVDEEVEEVSKLIAEVNECFNLILPRLRRGSSGGDGGGGGGGDNNDDDDDDDDSDNDDDNVNWEVDKDDDGSDEDEEKAGRKNEERAKKLLSNLRNNHVVEINTLLSTQAGGFHNDKDGDGDDDSDGDGDEEKQGLREALEETLKSSLASLKKHRAKKIQLWLDALTETQERGEVQESAPVLRGVLHKLVQAKSSLSELLGRAEKFERELGGGAVLLPPPSPRKSSSSGGAGGAARDVESQPLSRFDRKIKFKMIKKEFN